MTSSVVEPNIVLGTSFPPFLEKLQQLVKSCDPKHGYWSENGKHFIVCSEEFEEKVLKTYFKGSLKTFIRQLHFYSFKKSEAVGGKWSFSHPSFQRDRPELMSLIKRKTRLNSTAFASKVELDSLRTVVYDLKAKVESEFHSISAQLENIFKILNEVKTSNKRSSRNLATGASVSTSSTPSPSQKPPNLGYYPMSPGMNFQPNVGQNMPPNYFQFQAAMHNQARAFGFPGMTPWPSQQGQNGYTFDPNFLKQLQQNQNVGSTSTQTSLNSLAEESRNRSKRSRKRKKKRNSSKSTSTSDSSQPGLPFDDRSFKISRRYNPGPNGGNPRNHEVK